jgi:hypothetical protein
MVTRAAMMRRPLPSRTVANNPVQPTGRAAARTAADRVAVGQRRTPEPLRAPNKSIFTRISLRRICAFRRGVTRGPNALGR